MWEFMLVRGKLVALKLESIMESMKTTLLRGSGALDNGSSGSMLVWGSLVSMLGFADRVRILGCYQGTQHEVGYSTKNHQYTLYVRKKPNFCE